MSLDDLQAQLRGTLEAQFAALKQQYDDALAEARRQAVAEAERDAAVKLAQARAESETQLRAAAEVARADAKREMAGTLEQARAGFEQARAEWETHLHAVAAAARAEGEQRASEAVQQVREEHEQSREQAVNQAVAAARRTAELERESERRRAQNDLEAARQKAKAETEAAQAEVEAAKTAADAERQRALSELSGLRQRMQTQIAAARQTAASTTNAVAPPPVVPGVSPAGVERVLAAIREIDGAGTLSQVLDSLITHAAAAAGRAALFLINGDRLKSWKASGIPEIDAQTVESSIGAKDLLARAIQAGQATTSSPALPAPPFARLPADRAGLAVPLMIAGRAVAVLYVDSGVGTPPAGSAEAVEVLVRHASAAAGLRTAMRTLDVLGDGPGGGSRDSPAGGAGEVTDVQGARRYARLLVSEIKLYNEAAVRDGRQQRDLLLRLRAEIDRAQRLYEERVAPAVGSRHAYFQQELVQTLADGDPALLGTLG